MATKELSLEDLTKVVKGVQDSLFLMQDQVKLLRPASVDANSKNIKAIHQHAEHTRLLVREFEKQIKYAMDKSSNLEQRVNSMQVQIAQILQKVYTGGPTDS